MNKRRAIRLAVIACVSAVLLIGAFLTVRFGPSSAVSPGTVRIHVWHDKGTPWKAARSNWTW